jgi:T4 RnlA family RNA ligase
MSAFEIPSYQECMKICAALPHAFRESRLEVNGVSLSLFDYLAPTYKEFLAPVPDHFGLAAFELRGLCFVFENGMENEPKRYILLHKFFNLNQNEAYQLDQIKDKTIIRIQDKLDGSVIRFVEIGGKIIAKSKMSFASEQAQMAQKIFDEDENLQKFVRGTLSNDEAAIFELISPFNQIVVRYNKPELRLLQLRDEKTGDYKDIYSHPWVEKFSIKTTQNFSERYDSWKDLLEQAAGVEGVEGWVITLSDGMMIKLKTLWYCARHGIMTTGLTKADHLIELIIKDSLDDALAMIGPDDFRYKNATTAQSAIMKDLHSSCLESIRMIDTYCSFENRKAWFEAYKDHQGNFAVASALIREANALSREELFARALSHHKSALLKNCYRLSRADSYLKSLGVDLKEVIFDEE